MDYTPTTWVENITKVGPTNLNKLEAGVADAVGHHKTGLDSSKPVAVPANKNWRYYATDTHVEYQSDGTQWVPLQLGLSGAAGGDLAGSYPNPTIAKLSGLLGDATVNLYRLGPGNMKSDGSLYLGQELVVGHAGGANSVYFGSTLNPRLYSTTPGDLRLQGRLLASSDIVVRPGGTDQAQTGIGAWGPAAEAAVALGPSLLERIYRKGVGILASDNSLYMLGTLALFGAMADANAKFYIAGGSGALNWGGGGASATDAALSRSAAGVLRFDAAVQSSADRAIRLGEGRGKSSGHDYIGFYNATDAATNPDFLLQRPPSSRDLRLYSPVGGDVLVVNQATSTVNFPLSPTVPTLGSTDNSQQVASTAHVKSVLSTTPSILVPLTAAFSGGWTPYAPGGGMRYWKDQLGYVHVDGEIMGGTLTANTLIFTFPAGYRPLARKYFKASGNPGTNTFFINTLGELRVDDNGPAATAYNNLGHIVFATF
jgi:hypothetical protein